MHYVDSLLAVAVSWSNLSSDVTNVDVMSLFFGVHFCGLQSDVITRRLFNITIIEFEYILPRTATLA
jgi:hypothetical protein